jgi:CRISPR/Cas system-associated endoribonuclease Cas2
MSDEPVQRASAILDELRDLKEEADAIDRKRKALAAELRDLRRAQQSVFEAHRRDAALEKLRATMKEQG